MEQLHYADEVRPTTEVPVPEGDVKPTELELAKQLIEQTSNDDVRAGEVQGHGARARAGDDPAEGRRPGHHRRRRRPTAAARSSTSWKRSRRASRAKPCRRRPKREGQEEAQGVVKLLAGTSGYAFKEWKGIVLSRRN